MLKTVVFLSLIFYVNYTYSKRKTTGPPHTDAYTDALINALRKKLRTDVYNFQPITETMKVTPRQRVEFKVPLNESCMFGTIIHYEELKTKPTFTWRTDPDTLQYFTMFFTRYEPDYDLWGYFLFHNWLVVNIPGTDVDKGDEILPYEPPFRIGPWEYTFLYRVVVYRQIHGKINCSEYLQKRPSRNFTTIDNFVRKHKMRLGQPDAINTFYFEDFANRGHFRKMPQNYTPLTSRYWTVDLDVEY